MHAYLIGAATTGIPLDSVDIEVTAENNDARFYGITTDDPSTPLGFRATVRLDVPAATPGQIADLHRYADETCPVMKVLRNPVVIQLVVAEPTDV